MIPRFTQNLRVATPLPDITSYYMPYDSAALTALNDDFTYAVSLISENQYQILRRLLRKIHEISTLANVDAWFGRASFSRRYLSARTAYKDKDERILFAMLFLGRLTTNRPIVCRDFYLNGNLYHRTFDDFKDYFEDNYVRQNLDSITIDSEKVNLCIATESNADDFQDGEFDMNNPIFDEFRSGEEED